MQITCSLARERITISNSNGGCYGEYSLSILLNIQNKTICLYLILSIQTQLKAKKYFYNGHKVIVIAVCQGRNNNNNSNITKLPCSSNFKIKEAERRMLARQLVCWEDIQRERTTLR